MTYTVTWSHDALEVLSKMVAEAASPQSVEQAGTFADFALRRMPRDLGESRSGKLRVWYGDVLGVLFELDDEAMTVRVMMAGPALRR